ncbi:MAG: hypothetical protein R3F37_14315 [Candidatus Competibacteraceae bacterium]
MAYYQRQAEKLLDEGKQQEALLQIDAGLQINAQHEGLKQLKQRIREALADERKITQLLTQAEHYREQAQYLQPPGENAYDTYQQVLALDAENVRAQEGLAQILDTYRQQAEALRDQARWEDSLAKIDEILQVFPDAAGLQALRNDVLKAFAAERNQAQLRHEIERLLSQAAQFQEQAQLVQPPGANAYQTYQQVLTLDPANADAQAGLAQIVETYRQQAEELRDQSQWQDSLAKIDVILRVFPDDAGLQALRNEVQNAFDAVQEQEKLQNEIAQLLNQAEQYRQQGQFTQPADANAYQTFRRVLQLDSNNEVAQAGLNQLTQDILQQAQQLRQQGKLAASISAIEEGLRIAPQNQELQALRAQVKKRSLLHKRSNKGWHERNGIGSRKNN